MNRLLIIAAKFIVQKVMPNVIKVGLDKLDGKKFDGSKRLFGAVGIGLGIGMYAVPEIWPMFKPVQPFALDMTILGGSTLIVGTAHWLTKLEKQITKEQ